MSAVRSACFCAVSEQQDAPADYEDLKGKGFFPGLIKYMASGPVVAMVWEGLDAVKTGRVMLGATNPLASAPGTYLSCFFAVASIDSCVYRHHPW